MRLKHKAWFFSGAALGLAIPIGIRAYDVYERLLLLDGVPPFVQWLFWPTSLFMGFVRSYSETVEGILASLIFLGNALLYGVLAATFRRASIGIAAFLLFVAWMALPPSDNTLVKRFGKHRDELEQLVQMANQDAQLNKIGPDLVRTFEGKEYAAHEAEKVLSETRWAEYRRLFKVAGLNEGLYRSKETGEVFLAAHTLGKTDAVATYFGYMFCPDIEARLSNAVPSALPCTAASDSGRWAGRRWKKLNSEWYIYKVRNEGIE